MPYAALADLRAAYGDEVLVQLSDRAQPPANEIDEAVVAAALDAASAEMDGYLAGAVALPLATVPPLLREICEALAFDRLHRHLPAINDAAAAQRKAALQQLMDIRSGKLSLGLSADGGGEQPLDGSGSEARAPGNTLSAGNLKDFLGRG